MTFKKVFLTVLVLLVAETAMVSCRGDLMAADYRMDDAPLENNRISPYDMVLRAAADSSKWDWQLLAAIAHTESRFTADVRSPRGAVGLMQIMPRTAIAQGYDPTNLTDPRTSVEIAVKLLDVIEGTFRFPETMKDRERLKVILAAYNAGTGFILETRREAYQAGAAYNDWSTLRGYITRNGTHGETVAFVDKVLKKYNEYSN